MASQRHLSSVISAPLNASIDSRIEHSGAQTVNQSISATHEYLLEHYGPLMTLRHLAEVMHTSPNGLRMAIARRQSPLSVALANGKRQMGRRVFFEASLVANVIDRGLTGRLLCERKGNNAALSHASSPSQACTRA